MSLRKWMVLGMVLMMVLSVAACAPQQEAPAEEPAETPAEAPAEAPAEPEEDYSSYPEKPIIVFQGFAPGGGSDALAQLTQPYLSEIMDITFVNQYIPGATGAIAWTQLAKSTAPDGYTISVTNTPMLQTNYIMNEDITYNISELTPIANVVTDPGLIVVGADSPFQTIEDLMAAAEADPEGITVGNSGVGGDDFFSTLIFQMETGLKFILVPFEGDGPSWQAAAGNQIDVSFNNLGITFPQIQAGTLRPLAIFTDERDPNLPDVPTMVELGYNVVNGSSRGYSAPAGLPQPILDQLIAAFEQMAVDPEFLQAAADRALPVDIKTGEEYAEYLRGHEEIFGQIWEEVKGEYTQ